VDSDGDGFTDHWLAGVGYDRATLQWAGYNTWDAALHWYNVQSAFIAGNTMGVGYVRTFEFEGSIDNNRAIPEPITMVGLLVALTGVGTYLRKRSMA
jgi:hypothetical protein